MLLRWGSEKDRIARTKKLSLAVFAYRIEFIGLFPSPCAGPHKFNVLHSAAIGITLPVLCAEFLVSH